MLSFVKERPSKKWAPMTRYEQTDLGEQWSNKWYDACVRRFDSGFPIGGGPWGKLGICNADQTARHDWRDFQRIKNDIFGDEWEAVELYPAESRLIDPSNYFYLWCAPKGVFCFGLPSQHRFVEGPGTSIAPQRAFG